MPLDVVATLRDLVAIPSVNPMGRPVEGPEYLEYRVSAHLEDLFRRHGLPFARQPLEPKRENVLALVEGSPGPEAGGRVVLFEAHQDTVPVDGMTIPPWTPEIRQGRIYGRGACDIKGGMAAMLAAVIRLHEERPARRPTVVMACTVNEEFGFTGVTELTKLWQPGAPPSLVPRRPDLAVIAEPTSLDVVVAHKGTCRWKCHTRGRAGHSSQPHLGDNAIYRMARVLLALEAYARDEVRKFAPHRLCGGATLSVGLICGGLSVNTVPDLATIDIDRRLLPGEAWEDAYGDVIEYLRRTLGPEFPVEHERPFPPGPALADDDNGPLAEMLGSAARQVSGRGAAIGVPFGTDASKTAQAGVPSVVFGPGSIAQAHTADEWLPLDELEQASEILYRFLLAAA